MRKKITNTLKFEEQKFSFIQVGYLDFLMLEAVPQTPMGVRNKLKYS